MQEKPTEDPTNISLRSVSELEELLVPLEPRKDGGSDIDIEFVTESQLMIQTDDFIKQNEKDDHTWISSKYRTKIFILPLI